MRRMAWSLTILVLICLGPIMIAEDNDAQHQPPGVVHVRVGNIGETWFEVSWETTGPTLGGVEWGRRDSYGNWTNETGSYSTEHTLNVTGLKKGTNYHFRIFAKNLNGAEGYSSDQSIGTFPLGLDEGGLSVGTWAIVIAVVLVPILYLMFFRRE